MNQTLGILLIGSLMGGFAGCAPEPETETAHGLELTPAEIQAGQRVVRLQCTTCHGVGYHTQSDMLAPSLWAIRQHYILKHPEPDAFVDAMVAFIDDPQMHTALMPLAVEQYGLMAMLPIEESELRASARLIYAGYVERPFWARGYDKAHQACYDRLASDGE